MGIFSSLGERLLSESMEHRVKEYMLKSGQLYVPYQLYGLCFVISIFASGVIGYFLLLPKYGIIGLLMGIGVEIGLVIAIMLGFWIYYSFVIFQRTRKIEEVLPDFLQEVSINLKAGMSFDKALWNAIRPEYDVLEREIEIVAKRVMAGEDTEAALKNFAYKYDSLLLQESMDMIIVGIRSGGDVADLIDRIVENVKDASFLHQELIASVTSYIIFISLVAVIISPVLFALSFNLMNIIQSLGEKLAASTSSSVFSLGISYKSIDPSDFILFSKLSVLIISGVSSMIIAQMREGSIKAGIKYVLVFMPVSYSIYIVMLDVLKALFGTF